MPNLKEYKLGEICTITSSKRIFYNEYVDSGVPFFRSKEIIEKSKGSDISTELFITEDKYKEIRDKFGVPQNGDILLTSVGTLGVSYQVNESDYFYFKDGNLTWFKDFSKEINSRYLLYWLRSSSGKEALNNITIGSTQAALTIQGLKGITIPIPDTQTQTAIAEILSSLDDKIELNNQINQELEALAQALFQQWFIDFEFPNEKGQPYKSTGGEMVASELGEIPKGWKIYSMNELLETISKTYPLKKVNEVVFLNTGDIQEGKFLHNQLTNPSELPGQAKKSIQEGDILYSEIRPINRRFAYVYFDASKYVVSTKLMVLRSKVELNSLFQYFVLTQNEQIEYLQHLAESRSGTFPQITFSELSTIKIALPDFVKVNEFVDSVLKPYYDNQFNVKNENEGLAQLRDTLLPKLISGELEVSEVPNEATI
jgi:type I restriction enzyme S subunit